MFEKNGPMGVGEPRGLPGGGVSWRWVGLERAGEAAWETTEDSRERRLLGLTSYRNVSAHFPCLLCAYRCGPSSRLVSFKTLHRRFYFYV